MQNRMRTYHTFFFYLIFISCSIGIVAVSIVVIKTYANIEAMLSDASASPLSPSKRIMCSLVKYTPWELPRNTSG